MYDNVDINEISSILVVLQELFQGEVKVLTGGNQSLYLRVREPKGRTGWIPVPTV